jgi:hypothetical protein
VLRCANKNNQENAMDLTSTQTFIVGIVYSSALIPAALLVLLKMTGRLPAWIGKLYLLSLLACVVGWEFWITYGLVDGMDVNSRRPAALIHYIPQNINWLLNSLADAGAIGLMGVLLTWLILGRRDHFMQQWHWGAFCILFVWFVGQNLFVELYVYQQQLAEGYRLSWAPLMTTGPWYNPVLFTIDGRGAQLQTQLPWILMTPIYYWLLIVCYRGREKVAAADVVPAAN